LNERTSARLADQCVRFADNDCKGYSPIYDRVSRALATDSELLEWLTSTADARRVPLNLLAAVHYLARREPDSDLAQIYAGRDTDPWPAFRSFVFDHADAVAELMRTRTIQTNEVGRSAVLVPAIWWASRCVEGGPLALIEIGPSAGLNLRFDRYLVDYSDGRRSGDPHSRVQLACEVVGAPPPLPDAAGFPIGSRVGVDLSPVDVRDRDAVAWLEACIWPDVPLRLERFEAAVQIAKDEQSDSPRLVRGDAVELLPTLIHEVPTDHVPVVFATWALAYFSPEHRAAVHDCLTEIACRRDLVLITAEFPQVTPWYPEPQASTVSGTLATLLGATIWCDGAVHAEPLAWTHPHGQWLEWFAPISDRAAA
jgi:hypothetical protein